MTPWELHRVRVNRLHLSQSQLAQSLGVSTQAIQAWEQGRREIFEMTRLALQYLAGEPRKNWTRIGDFAGDFVGVKWGNLGFLVGITTCVHAGGTSEEGIRGSRETPPESRRREVSPAFQAARWAGRAAILRAGIRNSGLGRQDHFEHLLKIRKRAFWRMITPQAVLVYELA